MYELHPYFTNDGSVGLFSPEADDIYHSTYGALSEAYEKFVLPANLENFFANNSEIKVLDICYGIGYNSKSFLNFLIDKKFLNIKIKNKNFSNKIFEKFSKKIFYKKQNIVSIHTNNISKTINSETIDTYKILLTTRYILIIILISKTNKKYTLMKIITPRYIQIMFQA